MKITENILSNVKSVLKNDDKNENKKTDEGLDKRSRFDAQIDAIQNEYNEKTYADLKTADFEKLSYDEPSDDELMEKAKRSVADRFDKKQTSARAGAETKKKTLSEALAELTRDVDKQKLDAESAYGRARTETENSALKRGVARSSMAQNAVNEVIKALADKLTLIDDAAKTRADKINSDSAAVDDELKNELEKISDERSIAELDAFDKLKKESDDKRKETIKYNNSLEEKQKELELKSYDPKSQQELAEIKRDYEKKQLVAALDYYLSLPDPAAALKEFTDDGKMKDYLGYYYDYMFNILKHRVG
ncbi:MAG: hypothetical protein J6T42_03425 [Clostridia bacterium]|nr:hypothetical protein [Clostridia bacterium]